MPIKEEDSKQRSSSDVSDELKFFRSCNGYKYIHHGERYVGHHRLLAIAAGADPNVVFDGAHDVHHRVGHLDVPSNLRVLTRSDHLKLHGGRSDRVDPGEVLGGDVSSVGREDE